MGSIKIYKLKAATLVETIVSLVIILTVFSIATTIIVQISSKGASVNTIRAREVLYNYSLQTDRQKTYVDDEISTEGYLIRKVVSSYRENSSLKQIHYFIYDSNQQLLDNWQEVINIE